MESQGSPSEQNSVGSEIPHASPKAFCAQRPAMPTSPFVQGFGGAGNHMPFLYPHSFMPPISTLGFRPPTHGIASASIDLTEGSQKRGPQESVIGLSNSNKKRRAPRKKPEIVELDDNNDDSETLKSGCHWKDHWVIQLVTLRGEMQNTFSAPPKQGVLNLFRFSLCICSPNFFLQVFLVLNYLLDYDSILFQCFYLYTCFYFRNPKTWI